MSLIFLGAEKEFLMLSAFFVFALALLIHYINDKNGRVNTTIPYMAILGALSIIYSIIAFGI